VRVLLIDFYDSFTFNLAHYLEAMDLQLSVVRYDQLSQETLLAADAIILSPGPGLPNEKVGLSALLDQFVLTFRNVRILENAPRCAFVLVSSHLRPPADLYDSSAFTPALHCRLALW
jgi:hypothetical protein